MTDPVVSAADVWTVEDGDRTAIRIATVMTGGVSLAVWMGGVGYERNRQELWMAGLHDHAAAS